MDNWERILTEAGYRMTRSRRAIMRTLRQTNRALAPQEILALSQEPAPGVDLATVYRTLDLLAARQLVRRVHQDGGCHAYLAARQGHHHVIVCESCGRACEFRGADEMASLLTRVERETGYAVRDHLLQLTGLCPQCAQAGPLNKGDCDD